MASFVARMDACMPETNNFAMTPGHVAAINGRTRKCAALLRQCISECDGLAEKIGLESSGLKESRKRLGDRADDEKELAMYFPVYGAVKAGKSTLLSCLTRTTILPSRPLPMTTIPIKILHKGGTEGISLVIPNAEQWNVCIADVVKNKTLSTGKDHPEHVIKLISEAKAGLKRFNIGNVLRDADAIADELMLLSDVARLCFLLDVDLAKYKIDLSLDHLPLITMDIAIFRNLGVDRPFYLVDTPGPNEARCSPALEKINRRVLEESSGALVVVPHNQIESRDIAGLMDDLGRCCAKAGKRLLVAVNQVDSMTDRAKELPAVLAQLKKNMGTLTNFDIIPVSSSRIMMMCELQAELDLERAGLAESKIWKQIVGTMGIGAGQLCDVEKYARDLVRQELETYNAIELVKAVKGIYLDSEALALKTRSEDLNFVCKALDEFVKQIETSMKGVEEQSRKLAELTAVINGVKHFRETVSNIRPALEKELRVIFDRLRENFVAWSKTEEWSIVDSRTSQRVEQTSFSNRFALIGWYGTEGEDKIMPRLTKAFGSFVDDVLKEVPDTVDTQWAILAKLSGKIGGVIGEEVDAMVFTHRMPPTLSFEKPKIVFDTKSMGIPEHTKEDNTITIIMKEFTDAVLSYFIKQSTAYADAALACFEESLAIVLSKFEEASMRFTMQADDMMKVQKELQQKAHLHAAELRDFVTRVTRSIKTARVEAKALSAELELVAVSVAEVPPEKSNVKPERLDKSTAQASTGRDVPSNHKDMGGRANGSGDANGSSAMVDVVFLDGNTVRVPYSPNQTILSLKTAIENQTKVNRVQLVLVYGDVTLKDLDGKNGGVMSTLGGLGVPPGATIRAVVAPYTVHVGQHLIVNAQNDRYGNALGSAYDLGLDGAFRGTVVVLHLYTGEGFTFAEPAAALKKKGFTVLRYANTPPSPEKLEIDLASASQLWVISDQLKKLNEAHKAVIKRAFDRGVGVYIWGDNIPFYADANAVSMYLLGCNVSMSGDTRGGRCVRVLPVHDINGSAVHYDGQTRLDGLLPNGRGRIGFIPNHPITTGIANLFEGHTIATVQMTPELVPIMWGSAGNLVTAAYDSDGKRLIIDGGFTRLYSNWDEAGSARFVSNAAAWLHNFENTGVKYALMQAEPIRGASMDRRKV